MYVDILKSRVKAEMWRSIPYEKDILRTIMELELFSVVQLCAVAWVEFWCFHCELYIPVVFQYNETNVMHFSFNLLRIKGLYMFRTLLGHSQEALHKRHLVYCVRVMSVGCIRIKVVQLTDITRTQYTKCRLWSAFGGWATNPRNM
jgi:hypothetical protein